ARILGLTSGVSPQIVLELKPRDALLQRRYYDSTTYLLRRVETQGYDGHTRVNEYDDYRPFEGLQVARTERYHDGNSDNDTSTQVVSLERTGAVDPSSLAIPASNKPFTFASDATVEIPATFTSSGIVVRLNVNGRGLDFILDSGASGVFIDRRTAQSLGMTLYGRNVETIGGDFSISTARMPDLSMGPVRAHNLAVSVVPYTHADGDLKIVGLLGSDFFESGVVTVDFRNQRVTISPRLASPVTGFSKVPISTDDYVPLVTAAFNGKDGHFIADLGGTVTVLYSHYFSQFKAPNESDDDNPGLTFVGGATKTRNYRLSTLNLGDYDVHDVEVAVPSNLKVEGQDYDGLIGRDILRFFTVIFDYSDAALYVKPYDQ
ncbi:MAG: aspartyl protease family protein, partial [Candidatus Eremiobacteraeota bacterium]|nr:aspartyl protease family protein [Candidatus Eremiobacteraeota bacterium]